MKRRVKMKHFTFTFLFTILSLMVGAKAFAYDVRIDWIYYKLNNFTSTAVVTYGSSSYNDYSGAIVIPAFVTYSGKTYHVSGIGDNAFSRCSGLTSITIPEGVTSIGNNAFDGCSSLTSITIPNSVRSIGNNAFDGCRSLTSVNISGFKAWCKITFSNVSSNPLSYARHLFLNGAEIKDLVIPNSVTSIGKYAFYGCSSLTSVTIPNSVTSIGGYAFDGCSSLTSVNISDIEAWCKITFSNGSSNPLSYARHLFLNGAEIKDLVIPNSVTSIGNYAFSRCSSLTSVIIPEGVTSIGNSAFYGCSSLTSVIIPEGVTNIGDYAFDGCRGLTSINIPEGVTSIGDRAFFYCSGLTSINIPEGVTSIGDLAFYDCSGLTSVTIPNSVTSIGYDAFDGCSSLTSVNISDIEAWCKITFSNGYSNPLSYARHLFLNGAEIKDLVIPNSVTSIGNSAFYGCSSLTSVIIPEGVTSIGKNAFSGCIGLSVVCNRMVPPSIYDNSFPVGTFVIVPNEAVNRYRTTEYWNKLNVNIPISYVGNSQTTITLRKADPCSNVSVIIGENTYSFSQSDTLKIEGLSPGKEYTITAYGTFNDTMLGGTITAETRTVKPEIRIDNTTNVTATLTGVEFAGDAVVVECGFEGFEPGKTITVSGLKPGNTYTYSFYVVCSEGSRFTASQSVTTVPITLSASAKPGITSSLLTGSYSVIDATITESGFRGIDKQDHVLIAGLDPKTSYTRYYYVRTAEGWEFDRAVSFTTEGLRLVTEQPKVISEGNVIVAAESNIYDEETNVGFEWRRTDWTDDFASNTGGAYIYEGTMEGYIRNLNANYLWKFRPYYLSNSGKYYYGDWVGIDPSNTSYFEPTVHTYSKIQIQGNTALVKGYALRGTDNVAVQGFKYWKAVAGAKAANYAPNRIAVPNDAKTVEATGQVMTANLKDLDYDTEYCYVAFVTTSEGETFYGEQQTFVTEADLTPVEELKAENAPASIIARYDVQGRRLNKPIRGINIILMSDGTTRKVVVK